MTDDFEVVDTQVMRMIPVELIGGPMDGRMLPVTEDCIGVVFKGESEPVPYCIHVDYCAGHVAEKDEEDK